MRYIMRERILSWGDDFTIKNADSRDAYYVDGKVFSFGDKLSPLAPTGQTVQGRADLPRLRLMTAMP